jgi:hypothetical protein
VLRSNEKQFRGGLVFKTFVSLNSRPRVIKKKKALKPQTPNDIRLLLDSYQLEFQTLNPEP